MPTPASTPADNTPRMAATAIQKSVRCTRYSRFTSGTSIMPDITASMMSAASTAFGRSESSGASTSSVKITTTPVVRDAAWVFAPEESARELAETGRHGDALQACPEDPRTPQFVPVDQRRIAQTYRTGMRSLRPHFDPAGSPKRLSLASCLTAPRRAATRRTFGTSPRVQYRIASMS